MRRTALVRRGACRAAATAALLVNLAAAAGEVEVVAAEVRPQGDGYRVDVTLRHADSGWEHYADQWEVLTPAGETIGTRTLHHPHVDEQPFTRSLTIAGGDIPPALTEVLIRPRDSRHGYGPTMSVALPAR